MFLGVMSSLPRRAAAALAAAASARSPLGPTAAAGTAAGLGTPDPVTAARPPRWHDLSLHGLGFHSHGMGFSFESMMYMHIRHVFVMFLSLPSSPTMAFLL